MFEFFKTPTGKKTEAALWQMLVLFVGILVVAVNEFNVAWLVPYIGLMNQLTKWVNVTYIK